MTQRITRMIQPQIRLSLACLVALSASLANVHAHPGHRLGEHGASHIVTSPYHLAMLGLTGVALYVVSRFVQRRLPRRLLQGAALAALVLTAALWGMRA